MSENSYKKMLSFLENHIFLKNIVVLLGKVITVAVYIFFPAFLIYLYLISYNGLLKIILIPLISFIILSIVRRIINLPRPYEKYDITPLYKKDTKGLSCPSRHTFSAFVIGFCVMYVSVPLGVVLTLLAVILAVTRVLCGVHFIRDVVWGAIAAALAAIIGILF